VPSRDEWRQQTDRICILACCTIAITFSCDGQVEMREQKNTKMYITTVADPDLPFKSVSIIIIIIIISNELD